MIRGDACNRNQFMGNKPSSRVLAQPGGNSSFSLGWEEPAPKPVRKAEPQQQQQFQPQQQQQQQFQQQQFQPPQQQQQFQQQQFQPPQQQQQQAPPPTDKENAVYGKAPVSSNAWASNASQNSGNMLSERPSTRIHAPPGGKSSITF